MAWTFCASGSAISKAGFNANSTIVASGSTLANWSNEAENHVCVLARYDLIDNYSSLEANGKQILQQYCSADVAERIASYEPAAYSPAEFSNIINVLENQKKEVEKLLTDDKFRTYLGVAR